VPRRLGDSASGARGGGARRDANGEKYLGFNKTLAERIRTTAGSAHKWAAAAL
jgi:hypothetical protein